jgi:hypothetical protein
VPPFGHAERIAEDKTNGLALVRLYGARNLASAPFAESNIDSGDLTLIGVADPLAQHSDAVTAAPAVRAAVGAAAGPGLGAGFFAAAFGVIAGETTVAPVRAAVGAAAGPGLGAGFFAAAFGVITGETTVAPVRAAV